VTSPSPLVSAHLAYRFMDHMSKNFVSTIDIPLTSVLASDVKDNLFQKSLASSPSSSSEVKPTLFLREPLPVLLQFWNDVTHFLQFFYDAVPEIDPQADADRAAALFCGSLLAYNQYTWLVSFIENRFEQHKEADKDQITSANMVRLSCMHERISAWFDGYQWARRLEIHTHSILTYDPAPAPHVWQKVESARRAIQPALRLVDSTISSRELVKATIANVQWANQESESSFTGLHVWGGVLKFGLFHFLLPTLTRESHMLLQPASNQEWREHGDLLAPMNWGIPTEARKCILTDIGLVAGAYEVRATGSPSLWNPTRPGVCDCWSRSWLPFYKIALGCSKKDVNEGIPPEAWGSCSRCQNDETDYVFQQLHHLFRKNLPRVQAFADQQIQNTLPKVFAYDRLSVRLICQYLYGF